MGINEQQIDHVYRPHALAVAGTTRVGMPSEARLYVKVANLLFRHEVVGILTNHQVCVKYDSECEYPVILLLDYRTDQCCTCNTHCDSSCASMINYHNSATTAASGTASFKPHICRKRYRTCFQYGSAGSP